MITRQFAPSGGAASILTTRTAIELAKRGHEMTVLTGPLQDGAEPPDVMFTPRLQVIRDEPSHRVQKQIANKIRHEISKIWPSVRHIPRWDPWYLFSRKLAKQTLDVTRPDLIYSRSNPFSSHLIAERLHREAPIPWVAHFGDPLVGNPYMRMNWTTRRLNLRTERRIFLTAGALLFTNQVQQQLMLRPHLGDLSQKAHILPPYFNKDDFETGRCTLERSIRSSVTVMHIGRLYGLRSAESLLRALIILQQQNNETSQIHMVFVGSGRNDERNVNTVETLVKYLELDRTVEMVDEVSYEESLCWMAEADVLVSIDAPTEERSPFLPSKLIPYGATGKPVLNLTTEGSASSLFTNAIGGKTAPPDDPVKIAKALNMILQKRTEEFVDGQPKTEAIANYEIGPVHDHLERILETVANR